MHGGEHTANSANELLGKEIHTPTGKYHLG